MSFPLVFKTYPFNKSDQVFVSGLRKSIPLRIVVRRGFEINTYAEGELGNLRAYECTCII